MEDNRDGLVRFSEFVAASGYQLDEGYVRAAREYALYLASLVRRYGWYEAAALLDRLIFQLFR